MDKSSNHSCPTPATDSSSESSGFCSTYMEQTICVVLHVFEAINFSSREVREGEREKINMNAALNTVDFEVESSPSSTAETIIFNSICIWESDMAGIKRIKADHRPVKVTFYACSNSERKIIGSLLLPIRGLPVLGTGGNNSPLQLKMFWHKLTCISNEFRSQKPEVLLMLAIIKKSLLHTKEFNHLTGLNRSEKQSRTPPLQSPGHIQLQHPDSEVQHEASQIDTPKQPSTECQIFQCGQCPSKYSRKYRLTAHVKKYHTPGATVPSTKVSKKSFLCAICGKAVTSSSHLTVHIRRHTGEKPYKCDYCDMAFPRSCDLQCHRRTHTGERPHVCTVCQKGFTRSYKLQQHMRIHSGERAYKCTYCDKSFTQANGLSGHLRQHTGERPYQCNTCGERFIQGTALKNHRLQHGHHDTETDTGKDGCVQL